MLNSAQCTALLCFTLGKGKVAVVVHPAIVAIRLIVCHNSNCQKRKDGVRSKRLKLLIGIITCSMPGDAIIYAWPNVAIASSIYNAHTTFSAFQYTVHWELSWGCTYWSRLHVRLLAYVAKAKTIVIIVNHFSSTTVPSWACESDGNKSTMSSKIAIWMMHYINNITWDDI